MMNMKHTSPHNTPFLWIWILLACLIVAPTYGQTVKELEQQRKKTLQQLANTGKLLNETKKNEKVTLNKLNIISRNIADRKQLINNIGTEINAINLQMDSLNMQKDELEQNLKLLKADYAQLITQTHYTQSKHLAPLLFVLSADSFDKMYRRIRYLQEFADYRKQQAQQIESIQAEITLKNQTLEANRKSKQEIIQLKERENEKLAGDQRKQNKMLSELKKKESQLRAKQKQQQKKADELNNRIEKLIAEEVAKSKKKQTTGGKTTTKIELTKEEALIAGNFEKNKGRLPWPVEKGYISKKYGVQPHPVLEHVTINNKGIHIKTNANSDARAVFEGEVTKCFSIPGSNNAVIIKHGNYYTVYANLTQLYVKAGDKVSPKQKIGRIYTDPEDDNNTELELQIRKETTTENPANWLAH